MRSTLLQILIQVGDSDRVELMMLELPAPQAAAKVVAKQLTLTIPEKIKVEKTISKLFSSCLSWEKKDRPNFHQISDILATL